MKDGTDETKVNLGAMLKINHTSSVEGDANGDELFPGPYPWMCYQAWGRKGDRLFLL